MKEIIAYSTNTCPQCKANKQAVQELAESNGIKLYEKDATQVPLTELQQNSITSVPTYVLVENDKVVGVVRGSVQELTALVKGE